MPRPAWPAILGVALAALYLGLAARSPVSLGFFGDDAVYATTAKALAEGRGYRHLSIPGEPLQTKYPPLHPAVLSLVFRARPDFPANFAWLLVPGALAGAGSVVLAACYWRRALGASGGAALALGLLAALAPAQLAFVRYAMSELLYALLATAALLCLDVRAPRDGGRGSTPWLLLGAGLAAAAALTRTIGISLALAAVATPLLRRRFADALLVAAVLVAGLAPWWSWQTAAEIANGAAGRAFLVAHEVGGYARWLPDGPLEAFRVIGQNLLRLSFGLGYFQLALPIGWVRAAIAEGGVPLVLLHVVCHATLALALLGLALSLRAGLRTLHLYAALYGAVLLVWSFSPYRYLVPWTPFLVFFAATGLRATLAAGAARLGGARVAAALGGIAYACVLALFLSEAWKLARSSEPAYFAREASLDWSEFADVERFVREHTREDEVIASAHPERLFLATGRRGHYFWPPSDFVALDYDRARAASRFTILPVPAEIQAFADDVEPRLARVYREAEIAWYVEWAVLPYAQGFARVIEGHPGWFERRYTTPGRRFSVYRVQIPKRTGGR